MSAPDKDIQAAVTAAAAPAAAGNGRVKQPRPEAMARSSGIVLLGTLTGRGLNFIAQVVLSKLLGLQAFGLFTYSNALLSFLDGICLGGFSQTTVRYIAMARAQARPADIRRVMRVAVLVITTLSLLISAALFAWRGPIARDWIGQPEMAAVLPWLAVILPVLALLSWLGFALRAFREVGMEALIRRNVQPVALLLFAAGVSLVAPMNVHWAMAAVLASTVLAALFGLLKLRPHLPPATAAPATVATGAMLHFARRVWFSRFSGLVLNQADRLMIGSLSSLSQVGIYHAAFRIADFQTLAMGSFVPMFSTVIAEAHGRGDRPAIINYYRMVVRWSLFVTLPICLACWVFAAPILQLFGGEFVAGVPVLRLIALAALVDAGVGPAGQFLQMMGREKWEMRFLFGAAIMAVALNAVLIPSHGALGAALGSGVAIVILNVSRLLALRKLLGVYPYTVLTVRLLAVGMLALLTVWLVSAAGIWVQGLVLAAIMAAGSWLFCLHPDDRVMLQRLRQRMKSRG
ncbi:MAG: flippase [candidate division KSB1 bacterium]|nr:flippase [candidate division KSB1 bacterium]MDZ7275626.1 flippase [candidate division KSB1 bacterium]MDZ7284683.1 flippase [candidate division KSB1 bacterium]MDZ7297898.1 flippase [candidate division KSB1 bacterium]MDZ7305974.1 flippase [candidate division KSB1 bacterium]